MIVATRWGLGSVRACASRIWAHSFEHYVFYVLWQIPSPHLQSEKNTARTPDLWRHVISPNGRFFRGFSRMIFPGQSAGLSAPLALHRALRRMAGLVSLVVFCVLAGVCQRNGVVGGVFIAQFITISELLRAQRGAGLPRGHGAGFLRPWLFSTAEARTSNSP